jgi:hypothetical protein
MSQIYKALTSGPVPPTVPTSFVTDDGTAVPALNILNVNGLDSTENNVNGILTRANPNLSDNLEIVITNRIQGTGTTVSTGTSDIFTFVPTIIGVYAMEIRIAAFNTTSLLGAGYSLFGSIRFDGVNSNICDPFDPIDNEEGTMTQTGLNIFVSGSSVILRATGYLAQTINWSAVCLYTFVGA